MVEKKNAHFVNPLESKNTEQLKERVKVVLKGYKDIDVLNARRLLLVPLNLEKKCTTRLQDFISLKSLLIDL